MSRVSKVLAGLFLFSLLVVVVPRGVALEPVAEMWIKEFGGAFDEVAYSAVQTLDGGYAIAGLTGSYGKGKYDVWLLEIDRYGNLIWNRTYGGVGEDVANSLIQTSDGGYAMAGSSDASGAGSNFDFYLVKTDADGNEQWNKTYGGGDHEFAYSVIQTLDGGYALAGYNGGHDFWLIKTDETGHAQWNHTYGGIYADEAHALVQTSDGGYAIVGQTNSFGAGGYDFWLVKTDESGTMEWNRTYGGTGNDYARAMVRSADEGYALAGATTSLGAGDWDFWLIRTDASGNEQWNETYGGASFDFASCTIQTNDGGYAMVGTTYSFVDGSGCFWLVKTDSEGRAQWNQTYLVTGSDHGNSLLQTSDSGYLLVGLSGAYSWKDFLIIKTDGVGVVSEFPVTMIPLVAMITVSLSLALIKAKIRRRAAYSNA